MSTHKTLEALKEGNVQKAQEILEQMLLFPPETRLCIQVSHIENPKNCSIKILGEYDSQEEPNLNLGIILSNKDGSQYQIHGIYPIGDTKHGLIWDHNQNAATIFRQTLGSEKLQPDNWHKWPYDSEAGDRYPECSTPLEEKRGSVFCPNCSNAQQKAAEHIWGD